MARSLPDMDKLEQVAEYNRQRRTETGKELLEAAQRLAELEEQADAARKEYEAAYNIAVTDAWTVNELVEAGFETPDRHRPRKTTTPRRKRAISASPSSPTKPH